MVVLILSRDACVLFISFIRRERFELREGECMEGRRDEQTHKDLTPTSSFASPVPSLPFLLPYLRICSTQSKCSNRAFTAGVNKNG